MKKKVEKKPEIKLDPKDEEFFVERLANIMLMQLEQEQAEKEKTIEPEK
jgi:hypothetical protein